MREKLLFIALIASISIYSQTKDDYDIYSTLLYNYHKKEKWNLIDDDDKPMPIVITNTMSDFALTQYDENFEFDTDYIFSREKFRFDPKADFGLERFAFLDKESGIYLFDYENTRNVYNIPNNPEINSLLEDLKNQFTKRTNLKRSKFQNPFPIKIISKEKIDQQYQYGKIKNNKEDTIDYKYLEFSTVVYSDMYAFFYVNITRYSSRSIRDESGEVYLLVKTDSGWEIIGRSLVSGYNYAL